MLHKLTHTAGRILAIYHIVIFERSHVTVLTQPFIAQLGILSWKGGYKDKEEEEL